jgi:hypothetical protein
MSIRAKAILALIPDANFTLYGNKISIWDSEKEQPTEKAIVSKEKEIIAAEKKLEYKTQRQREFTEKHPIGDQLDYIFHHGIEKWKTDIVQPIKDKYPKPT